GAAATGQFRSTAYLCRAEESGDSGTAFSRPTKVQIALLPPGFFQNPRVFSRCVDFEVEVLHAQLREGLHLLPAGEHVVREAEVVADEFIGNLGLIGRLAKYGVQPDGARENRLVIEDAQPRSLVRTASGGFVTRKS